MVFPLLQLFLAVFSIYSALRFPDDVRYYIILGCLTLMLIISWADKGKKKATEQKSLRPEIDAPRKKDPAAVKKQAAEALLCPKNELILVDAVHLVLKDLGLKVSTGVNYHSVDRIVRIPETPEAFGVEVMMSDAQAEQNHPKFSRALEFEREKKKREKILIIASTHTRLPVSERDKVSDISKELGDFLIRHNMSLITTHRLYGIWQRAKEGQKDIVGIFQQLYSHPGGVFPLGGSENSQPFSPNLVTPQAIS
jgi:hypothetical protein